MADKKGVVVNPKLKKKKKKGCSCCLVVLIVMVVLLTGIFATGWILGDNWTKANLDMGIGEVLGVYGDIRTVNKNKVGLNEYSESDVGEFEKVLKEQLFLKSSVEIPYKEIFDSMLGGVFGTSDADTADEEAKRTVTDADILTIRNSFLSEAIRDHGIVTLEAEEETAANPLLAVVAPLLTRENIDLERLAQYRDGDEVRTAFSDKQIAAFVDKIIKIGMEEVADNMDTAGSFSVAEVMKEAKVASVKISGTQAAPLLNLTVRANTAKITSTVLKNVVPNGFGWAVDLGTWMLLPKETYVSIELKLGSDPSMAWRINGLSDAKMARLNKLLVNAGKAFDLTSDDGGNLLDVQGLINNINEATVKPAIADLNSYTGYDKVSEGKLSTDLVGTALALSGINNERDEADRVNSSDVYFTMKALILSVAEVNTESAFSDQYASIAGADAGEVYYKPANFQDGSKYKLVDYQNEFMAELYDKYLLDESVTFKDIAKLFGIGGSDGGGTEDFIDKVKFEGDALKQLAKREENGSGTANLILTDRMIGVLFQEYLGTILSEGQFADGMDPAISHATLKKLNDGDGGTHNWIEIAFTVDVLKAVGSDGVAGALLKTMLPGETMMITVEIDITPDKPIEFYGEGSIRYNDLSESDTNRLLNIFRKFAPSVDFSPAGLLGQIEPEFRKVITDMTLLIPGIELGKSEEIDGLDFGGIEAGSVFDLAAMQLSTENENVQGEEMRKVVLALWDINESEFTAHAVNEEPDAFMRDAKDKYYLRDHYRVNPDDEEEVELASYDDLMAVLSSDSFSYKNLYLTPEQDSGSKAALAYDTRDIDDLRTFLSDRDFGAIMKNELEKREDKSSGGHTLTGFTSLECVQFEPVYEWEGVPVAGALQEDGQTGDSPEGLISIVINVDMRSFLADQNSKYLNLMPAKLYFTLSFAIADGKTVGVWDEGANEEVDEPLYRYYDYEVSLNNMERPSDDYDSLIKIITLANGGTNPVDIDSVAIEVSRALYDQLENLRDKLGAENLSFQSRYSEEGNPDSAVESGFRLGSIYHFLEKSDPIGKLDATILQGAVQGMYAYDAEHANVRNYKRDGAKGDAVIFNPIAENPEGTMFTVPDARFGWMLRANEGLPPFDGDNPFTGAGGYELAQFDSEQTGASEADLTITFEVTLNELDFHHPSTDDGRDPGYWGLAPNIMYFTFFIEWVEGVGYQVVHNADGTNFTINSMQDVYREQLFTLIGYNPESLSKQVDDCLVLLEKMPLSYGDHNVTISLFP